MTTQEPARRARALNTESESRSYGWLFFSPEGRINRTQFWFASLIILVAQVLSPMPYVVLAAWFGDTVLTRIVAISLCIAVLIASAYANLMVFAKRWHDLDRSGACTLFALVPLIGPLIVFIALGFIRGTHGPNAYGVTPGS